MSKTVYAGPGFLPLLTIVFIALKLTGHITWSWFWVLSPMLIPLILVVILIFVVGSITVIMDLAKNKKNKSK